MGHSRWDGGTYETYTSSIASMPREEIFSRETIDNGMNPKGVEFREARDSELNPNTTPIIVGLDVTGSMGHIAEHIARTGLGIMVNEILQRRPVTDPTVLIMGIGDVNYDAAPIQVGQFESDIAITNWLEALYLEGGGGGNRIESYDLPYYFAAVHTRTDNFELRNQPGVIVTIGDELPTEVTRKSDVQKFIGGGIENDIPFEDLIAMVRPMYIPYHIIIAEGHNARAIGPTNVKNGWANYLNQNALMLRDHTKIAQLIVSILEIESGGTVDGSIRSWDSVTRRVLSETLDGYIIGDGSGPRLPRRLDVPA